MKSAGSQTMALAWPGTPQQATSHADIATPATTGLPPPRPGREALGRSRGGLSTKAASRSLAGGTRPAALGAIIIGVINDLIEMLGIPALCEYIFAAAVLVIARPPGARPRCSRSCGTRGGTSPGSLASQAAATRSEEHTS